MGGLPSASQNTSDSIKYRYAGKCVSPGARARFTQPSPRIFLHFCTCLIKTDLAPPCRFPLFIYLAGGPDFPDTLFGLFMSRSRTVRRRTQLLFRWSFPLSYFEHNSQCLGVGVFSQLLLTANVLFRCGFTFQQQIGCSGGRGQTHAELAASEGNRALSFI